MNNLFLAIGCDSYDHLGGLACGEKDAKNIAEHLGNPKYAHYNTPISRVLLSPTVFEINDALASILKNGRPVGSFTFFFAGHGILKVGTLVLCTRDTHPDALTTTGFSLGTLFNSVNELGARHVHIILDACESGGVSGDVITALKPNLIGQAGSAEITLLAACAEDQSAFEDQNGGRFTNKLLACINGTDFVQDLTPTIDLNEIGKRISAHFATDARQSPIYWGLNLSANTGFVKNPHFVPQSGLRETLAAAPGLNITPAIREGLWQIYSEADEGFVPEKLRGLLRTLLEDAVSPLPSYIAFIHRIRTSLCDRAKRATDSFREIEIRVACLSSLLGEIPTSAIADEYALRECEEILDDVKLRLQELSERLRENDLELVGGLGLSELYFLPIRISKILGWAGVFLLFGNPDQKEAASICGLLHRVFNRYAGIAIAVSDLQAPFILTGLVALAKLDPDAAETWASLYFNSVAESGCCVAQWDLSFEAIPGFLLRRALADTANMERGVVANPTELVAVLLLLADRLQLKDTFDESLALLDHRSINLFVPETYSSYGDALINSGVNLTRKIGHDFFTVDELIAGLPANLLKVDTEAKSVAILSVLSSFIYPNRTPWHILL